MKTIKFKLLTVILAVFMLSPAYSNAQNNNQRANNGKMKACKEFAIPDLTPEQQTKLKELHTAHMKEMTSIKNQLQEKKAHLKTLRTSDNPNMNEIDKTIDEITALTGKMMKQRERMIQDIRKELTEEQKVYFDAHGSKLYARGKKSQGKMNNNKPPMR
ncbi:MAG: Spy/CpxP family protein refolding chaperone [Bacteroidales bacterium]|nr:Spy/CpxP family protein refolding chaperone [Bacteroidales bacterium]